MHFAQHLYRSQRIVLLTWHGKEKVITPVLKSAHGCQLDLSQCVESLVDDFITNT